MQCRVVIVLALLFLPLADSTATSGTARSQNCVISPDREGTSTRDNSRRSPPLRPMNICIIAGSSRGDIQPYVAIALALRKAGCHKVRMLTNVDHKDFVASFGFDQFFVYGPMESKMKTDPVWRKAMAEGSLAGFAKEMAQTSKENVQVYTKPFYHEMQGKNRPDLVLTSGLGNGYGIYCLYYLGIPVLDVPLQTVTHRKLGFAGIKTYPFGLHNLLGIKLIVLRTVTGLKGRDVALADLAASVPLTSIMSAEELTRIIYYRPQRPVIMCQPNVFRKVLCTRLPKQYRFVGAPIIDTSHQTGGDPFGGNQALRRLQTFLDADPKPVHCGWGSMVCKSPEYMVVRALFLSDQRGIVLGR